MPFLTQDIIEISVKNSGLDVFYGTTRDGTQIKLHNPQDNLPTGAFSGQYVLGSAVNVQGSLYFSIGYSFWPDAGVKAALEVFRMSQDGTVESVAYLTNTSPTGFNFTDESLDIASEHNGQYILNTSDFAL